MSSVKRSNSVPNEEDILKNEDSCLQNKANLKGDWLNVFLLVLLYTTEYIPHGFIISLPIIFQSKKLVTYEEQALFSMVLWPYTIKILWSPLVDSIFVRKIGRRMSWIIPIQYTMGFSLFYTANIIDEWIPVSGKPNIYALVVLFGGLFCLATVQDIAVDGWSITMLKRKNVGHSSTCNMIGSALGDFICMFCLILLTSEDFSNKYFRTVPGTGGIVTIKGFMYFWSVTIILIATLLWIFKKEKNIEFKDNERKINIIQSYKILWNILNNSSIRLMAVVMFTMSIAFAATDHLSILKLIDHGVPKDYLTLINISTLVIKFFIPIVFSKYTSGPKPLSALLNIFPLRLFWNLIFVLLIYYTPILVRKNGIIDIPIYYYIILELIIVIKTVMQHSMYIFANGFFCRISDPRFGGMYMTLLNIIYLMNPILSRSLALKTIDVLTISECSNDTQNNCSTSVLKTNCKTNNGDCKVVVNGYYVEVSICVTIGLIWYFICKKIIIKLQEMSPSNWSVQYRQPIIENPEL